MKVKNINDIHGVMNEENEDIFIAAIIEKDAVLMTNDPCINKILSDLNNVAQSDDEIVEVIDAVIKAFASDCK